MKAYENIKENLIVSIPYMGKVEQHFVDLSQYTTYILLCQSKEMCK